MCDINYVVMTCTGCGYQYSKSTSTVTCENVKAGRVTANKCPNKSYNEMEKPTWVCDPCAKK